MYNKPSRPSRGSLKVRTHNAAHSNACLKPVRPYGPQSLNKFNLKKKGEASCPRRRGHKGGPQGEQQPVIWLVAPNLLVPGTAFPLPAPSPILEGLWEAARPSLAPHSGQHFSRCFPLAVSAHLAVPPPPPTPSGGPHFPPNSVS